MIPDVVVVIHGAAGVKDDVVADDGAGVDHHTSADHHSLAQADVRSEHGSRVDSVYNLLPPPPNRFKDASSGAIVADGHDDGVVVELIEVGDGSQDRQAQDDRSREGRIIVQEADGLTV